jgi:hypothetical protein
MVRLWDRYTFAQVISGDGLSLLDAVSAIAVPHTCHEAEATSNPVILG